MAFFDDNNDFCCLCFLKNIFWVFIGMSCILFIYLFFKIYLGLQILSTSQKVEEPSGPDTRAGQGYPQYESPIIIDQLGQRYQYQGLVSAQNGMGYLVGPIGIPDLNVSVEETLVVGSSQPFDVQRMEGGDKKTRYAEARRYRMDKNKSKIKGGPRSTTLPSFPCRR